MLQNIFRNLPPITKNLLIINVLFFLATIAFQARGIDLTYQLGVFYIDSSHFKPYQLFTNFFMHFDFMHLFFNMFILLMFGSPLERIWGNKRYLLFYIITALGASIFNMLIQGVELYYLTGNFFPFNDGLIEFADTFDRSINEVDIERISRIHNTVGLGASGAVIGLLVGFGMLNPNQEFRLLFPPIAIKAKWYILILLGITIFSGISQASSAVEVGIGHFAHLGGMITAFILVKIWQKDRTRFY